MLTIRLSRTGKKKAPQYRIVLQERHRDPWSPAKEILGTYNPRVQENGVNLKTERIEYWLGQGVQPSNTVHNLLVNAGLIKADKQKVVRISKKRAAKMEEKKAEVAEKENEEAEATKATEEKKTAEEAEVEGGEGIKEEKKEESA